MKDSELLEHLRRLETELHRQETNRKPGRLERLLHPDFVEFGRSGRRYSRSEILEALAASGATVEAVHAERFELSWRRQGTALMTYVSAHETATGELYRRTLRSSLWVETEAGWQLRFHQGTPADAV